MKKRIKKFISFIVTTFCLFSITSIPTLAAEKNNSQSMLAEGISELEQKYNVTIKEAPTAKDVSTFSTEEANSLLEDLETTLSNGQEARIQNQLDYENYISELETSGRLDNDNEVYDTSSTRARKTRTYYHNIGSVMPGGTTIRCSMTGTTIEDSYGNTIWDSLNSHSSRLSSGYGTGWKETDFSAERMDRGRTVMCSYIGTLEEPYKQSGIIQYYVYSEGWRIWFEAYAMD